MALRESALNELLDVIGGEGTDMIREIVRWAAQELIEAEASERIGAGPYERTHGRVAEGNGHRSRTLSTRTGDIELASPKLRKGSSFPSILEPRRRIDQALYSVIMEAYVSGVSTRAVDDLVKAMGIYHQRACCFESDGEATRDGSEKVMRFPWCAGTHPLS